MARAATLARPATDPHRATAAREVARVCSRKPDPGDGYHHDLGDEDRLPRRGLARPKEGGEVPEAGDDQHGVGRPGQAGEGAGQCGGGLGTGAAGRTDQARHDDLPPHPDRRRQHVQGEAERVQAGGEHGASVAVRLLALPARVALLRKSDWPFSGVGRGEHHAHGLRVDLPPF